MRLCGEEDGLYKSFGWLVGCIGLCVCMLAVLLGGYFWEGESRAGWNEYDGMYTFTILYFPPNQIEESKGTRGRQV